MENSNSKVSAAFVKAQSGFGAAVKKSNNPHFKSKYADLASCVDAVMQSFNDNGIALLQQVSECSDGVIVETIFIHESGERIECGKLHFPASKQDAQGYMSALTYARRGSLMAACGIAPEDDDGNAASKPKQAGRLSDHQYQIHSSKIKAAQTIDELTEVFTLAYRQAKYADDTVSLDSFVNLKDDRKLQLTKGNENG